MYTKTFNYHFTEMTCERQSEIVGIGTVESVEPTGAILEALDTQNTNSHPSTHSPTSTSKPVRTSQHYETTSTSSVSTSSVVATHLPTTLAAQPSSSVAATRRNSNNNYAHRAGNSPRPPLVHGSPLYKKNMDKEIVVKDVLKHDNSLIIRWESENSPLGFKVIYRLFGESSFKSGPPLDGVEREFKIKGPPAQV